MREKRKELWSQRESSVLWHLIQKSPVPTLLREEQKDKHYIRGSILISATERQGGACNSCQKELYSSRGTTFRAETGIFPQMRGALTVGCHRAQ